MSIIRIKSTAPHIAFWTNGLESYVSEKEHLHLSWYTHPGSASEELQKFPPIQTTEGQLGRPPCLHGQNEQWCEWSFQRRPYWLSPVTLWETTSNDAARTESIWTRLSPLKASGSKRLAKSGTTADASLRARGQ